jgi:hypothetical protein
MELFNFALFTICIGLLALGTGVLSTKTQKPYNDYFFRFSFAMLVFFTILVLILLSNLIDLL